MNVENLKGKKVVLIGGAGFIGHHLALKLNDVGAVVYIIDNLGVNNYHSVQRKIALRQESKLYLHILEERLRVLKEHDLPILEIDARDYHKLSEAISELNPDYIVQLAAVAHAGLSNKDPHSTFDHSVRTLENALDIAKSKKLNIKHFVYFSSSMVYGNFKDGFVTEESPCDPLGIYGALKYAGEKIVQAYHQVFGLPYTIIRPSALYGPRCISKRVTQVFIESALKGETITVNGSGEDRLDFTFVEDLVQGVIRVLDQGAKNQTFNLTYGQSRSVADVLGILKNYFPEIQAQYMTKDNLMPDRGTLGIDRAKTLLGYQPEFPLEVGYGRYIEWYLQNWENIKVEASKVHPVRARSVDRLHLNEKQIATPV